MYPHWEIQQHNNCRSEHIRALPVLRPAHSRHDSPHRSHVLPASAKFLPSGYCHNISVLRSSQQEADPTEYEVLPCGNPESVHGIPAATPILLLPAPFFSVCRKPCLWHAPTEKHKTIEFPVLPYAVPAVLLRASLFPSKNLFHNPDHHDGSIKFSSETSFYGNTAQRLCDRCVVKFFVR